MSAKILFALCAQALFVQLVLSQCTSRAAVADRSTIGPVGYGVKAPYGLDAPYNLGAPWGLEGAYGLGAPCGYAGPAINFSPTSGGKLPVTSASAVAPVGLSVASENVFEGKLAAAGEVPFVGTVEIEGELPTAGVGAINHHCGDGINAMVSDKTNIGYADAFAPGIPGAFAPSIAGAYDLGVAAPGIDYRTGWAGKSCGCGIF